MRLATLPFLLAVLPCVLSVQLCPSTEFVLWKGHCYSFHRYDYSYDWHGAQQRCQDKSTSVSSVDLAIITSAEENEFVYSSMRDIIGYNYWIGLRKEAGTGVDNFRWVDGTILDYINWGPGEPNDHQGEEDCVEIMTNPRAKWNDILCSGTSNSYVCEGPSYDTWMLYDGKEYYINTGEDNPTWYDARFYCNENGGELASLTSAEETAQITGWLTQMQFTADVWIGLNKLDADQTQWMWSDYQSIAGYTNWKYGSPVANPTHRKLCGAIRSDDTKGEWYEDHCDEIEHAFVCERTEGDLAQKTPSPPPATGGFCPNGYHEAGNKCYRVHFRDSHNGHTWDGAADYCRRRTGYLADIASINNPLEQAVLTSLLQQRTLPLWVGLYRRRSGDKEWLWSDNSPFQYTNWLSGAIIPSSSLCVDVRPYAVIGSWGARDCDENQGFVCQIMKDPGYWLSTPPLTTTHNCKAGYTPYATGCYKYYPDLKTWEAAKLTCSSDMASLASIHDGPENGFVQSLAWDKQMPVWIGLRDTKRNGLYTWSDNWAVTYTHWGADEPSMDETSGGCVVLRQVDGSWADNFCTGQTAFVCKTTDAPPNTTPMELEGMCPTREWIADGSFCYKFVRSSSKTWTQALRECQKDSFVATLVSIHSGHENTFVYDQVLKMDPLYSHTWIGLYRTNTKGFGWDDLSAVNYENWAPGEPNGEAVGEDCVAYVDDYPGYWKDTRCTSYYGYVCKAPKVQIPSMPPTVNGTCPIGWVSGGYHCYLFKPNIHLRWIMARQYCKDNADDKGNGDLVIIRSLAEDVYVNSQMFFREDTPDKNKEFWLGLTKQRANAPYLWIDETTLEDGYTNWEFGEPDSADEGDENCVMQYVDNTKWADTDCGDYKGFACKIEKASPDPTDGVSGGGDDGLSGGAIAGIVIGTLLGVLIIAIVVMVFAMNINVFTKAREMSSGFSNPFYSQTDEPTA